MCRWAPSWIFDLMHKQSLWMSGLSSFTVPPPLGGSQRFYCGLPLPYSLQAVEAAQLAEDLKVQLEHTQSKLKEIQVSVAENRTARERESSNLKRAQVCCIVGEEGGGGCLRRSIR